MTKRFTIREVADRSGMAPSALRFYEERGLISSERDAAGRRTYAPQVLRRIAFITVGQAIGLPLVEIGEALALLPGDRAPAKRDWERVSRRWRDRLDAHTSRMQTIRQRLDACIGCGCLSLRNCSLSNERDRAAARGAGPRYLLGDDPAATRLKSCGRQRAFDVGSPFRAGCGDAACICRTDREQGQQPLHQGSDQHRVQQRPDAEYTAEQPAERDDGDLE